MMMTEKQWLIEGSVYCWVTALWLTNYGEHLYNALQGWHLELMAG